MNEPWIYDEGGAELLDRVAPLWEQLRAHHAARSEHFADGVAQVQFAARRAHFERCAVTGGLRVILARAVDARDLGYCVSTVADRVGEVESLFVAEAWRGLGLGTGLMERSLAWLNQRGIERKVLWVMVGNEAALPFYARFGFRPRSLVLQQTDPDR